MFVCYVYSESYNLLGDGHGGREVARFVENWLPKEAQRMGNVNDLQDTLVTLYNR